MHNCHFCKCKITEENLVYTKRDIQQHSIDGNPCNDIVMCSPFRYYCKECFDKYHCAKCREMPYAVEDFKFKPCDFSYWSHYVENDLEYNICPNCVRESKKQRIINAIDWDRVIDNI